MISGMSSTEASMVYMATKIFRAHHPDHLWSDVAVLPRVANDELKRLIKSYFPFLTVQ